ncbi:ABC transporter sub-family A-like protein [Euroglyphus maynei]|uniref:ABC transporter sub-family A-like protein n=1 Tax=Euroglyphus maynei TaxID=6958 RepID=A0A1Y3B4W2_EURMA|nr:ABC transporter sub-family A-like protein [Euroglyphus maynei]
MKGAQRFPNPQHVIDFSAAPPIIRTIYYTPDNQQTKRLLQTLVTSLMNFPFEIKDENGEPMRSELIPMDNMTVISKQMQNDLVDKPFSDFDSSVLGLNIREIDLENGHLDYDLLLPTRSTARTSLNAYPNKMNQAPNIELISWTIPVIELTSRINREFVRQYSNITIEMNRLQLMRMPYPAYRNPIVSNFSIFDILALFILISYTVFVPLIVKRITDEKSSKSKELLRMIGMSDTVFWSAHFINYLIVILIHALGFIIAFVCFQNPMIVHSSLLLFFLMFIMFGMQLIMFAMLITTVFNRPVLAVIVTTILWLTISVIIFRGWVPSINTSTTGNICFTKRFFLSMLPMGSIMWFISILGVFESLDQTLTFSTINKTTIAYGDLTILVIMASVGISYFLYAFLIWYLDSVWPFQYGVPKHPWFIFDPSYWRPGKVASSMNAAVEPPEFNEQAFEPDPVGLQSAIEIRNVTKRFSGNKIAVNNLWLNIYSHQLTVLLGHNGAGKSTTMNMITGIYPATSGNIYVNGYNIFTQTRLARQSIGLCTQENILFPELTVFEHLKLFAILKNTKFSNVYQEVQRVLNLLQLTDKCDTRSSSLSGGMKRKLQLGMALIGQTSILILDEPTSGLDPEARRVIWDLLISLRREKTILLTTHYMEEADVLGDRIAIMNQGLVRCCGTPFFLKNAFGTGYQLRVEKQSNHFDSNGFLSIISHYIPTVSLKSEIETEVIYTFNEKFAENSKRKVSNQSDNNVGNVDDERKKRFIRQFPPLFRDLEKNRKNYAINSFGLSYSTLEDVFLAVENDDTILESKLSMATSGRRGRLEDNDKDDQLLQQPRLTPKSEMVTGFGLILNQFLALLLKRFNYARRYWQMVLLQLIVPILIFITAMLITSVFNSLNVETKFDPIPIKTEHLYGYDTDSYYQGEQGEILESYKHICSERDHGYVINMGDFNSAISFEDFILNHNSDNIGHYMQKVLFGMQENHTRRSYNIWFNNEQTYSSWLSEKAFFDSFLDMVSPQHLKSKVGIDMTLQPVLIEAKMNGESASLILTITTSIISWLITCLILLPIAFPFLAASYVLYPIKERTSKSKLLQLMAGVSPTVFWLSHFIFDLVYHLLTISVLYLVIYLFDSDKVFFDPSSKSSADVLFVILFVFGIGTIPLAYLFAYIFDVHSSGFTFVVIIFLIMGLIANIFWSILDILINNAGIDASSNFLSWTQSILPIIRLIPIFSMLYGYQKLYKANLFTKMCTKFGPDNLAQICNMTDNDNSLSRLAHGCCPNICLKDNSCYDSASFSFGKFGSAPEIYSLIASGLIFMAVIILYENFQQYARKYLVRSIENLFYRIFRRNRPQPIQSAIIEDSDVVREKQRVESILTDPVQRENSDLLLVHQLTKHFGSFTAVDHLSFGVRHDECFGLLGVNGAGKTTTFSMLTGDLFPSDGNAHIDGQIDLISDLCQFQRNIGYCPQFDALLDNLTGVETLRLMGALRGIPWRRLSAEVDDLIRMVDLQNHASKRTETYSGGNRRKLSIAVSLIGNPRLLFLDEPTAGVDPSARRKIWRTLGLIRKLFNSVIILTSHSMEECEALCSRIAIMVAGRFRCLGSTQHLRAKYGQGYTILIRLKREHELDGNYSDECQRRIIAAIPSARLSDYHQCLMTFQIADKSLQWSELFEIMARLDNELRFEDYIVSDTTLENIFILFARNATTNAIADKDKTD